MFQLNKYFYEDDDEVEVLQSQRSAVSEDHSDSDPLRNSIEEVFDIANLADVGSHDNEHAEEQREGKHFP